MQMRLKGTETCIKLEEIARDCRKDSTVTLAVTVGWMMVGFSLLGELLRKRQLAVGS
jgi:hypothetical protein